MGEREKKKKKKKNSGKEVKEECAGNDYMCQNKVVIDVVK